MSGRPDPDTPDRDASFAVLSDDSTGAHPADGTALDSTPTERIDPLSVTADSATSLVETVPNSREDAHAPGARLGELPEQVPNAAAADAARGLVWFVAHQGLSLGPFTAREIRARVVSGALDADRPIWLVGDDHRWRRVADCDAFADALASPESVSPATPSAPERCPTCSRTAVKQGAWCRACGQPMRRSPRAIRAVAIVGAVGALSVGVGLALPWTAVPLGVAEVAGASTTIAASDLAIGDALVVLGGVIVLFGLAGLRARTRRVMFPPLVAAALVALTVSAWPGLESSAASATADAWQSHLGWGLTVLGAVVVVAAHASPLVRATRARPIAAGAALGMALAIAAVYAWLLGGDAYATVARWQLEAQGYEVHYAAVAPIRANRWPVTAPMRTTLHAERDGARYVGFTRAERGGFPSRRVTLQRVPPAEQRFVRAMPRDR